MDYLWSPWRMEYIENNKADGCVFCNAQAQADGDGNLIACRGEHAYVILNRYPYTSGHLMVIPLLHKPNLEELDAQTRAEMIELDRKSTRLNSSHSQISYAVFCLKKKKK